MPAPRSIPSGSITIFCQAAAPVGWTRLTTIDNCGLRIVSGAVGSAGTSPFTSCFTNTDVSTVLNFNASIGSHTLSTSQLPSHNHLDAGVNSTGANAYLGAGSGAYRGGTPQQIGPSGGGGAHSHGFTASPSPVTFPVGSLTQNIALSYVDVIQCSRN